jgi:mercuric reductase
MRHDLAIIGSGGAAFAAAITARDAGASVVMIERGAIGGTCVNTGCVPSKALLAAAAARHGAASQPFPGIATQAGPVDMAALAGGKDELAAAMRAGKYVDLAADYGWEIIAGTARFAAGAPGPVLEVRLSDGGTTAVDAGQYLVATGAVPWIPPVSGLAETGYLTPGTAMELTELPESMLVIGGNATGLELAQLFARLGVTVTIAEALDRLAPCGEPEISAAIEDVFDGEGIGILTAASVVSVRRDGQTRSAVIKTAGEPERELAHGQILVAAGRRPVTAGLNLDVAGVATGGRGEILTDSCQRTANPRIWAAGGVTGGPQFVYVAAAQGSAAAANALAGAGAGRTADYTALPRVTFTSPAIASAGLTETGLTGQGAACDCRVLPLSAVPRAVVDRDTRGVIKLVAEAGTGARPRGARRRRRCRGDDHGRVLRDPGGDDRHRSGAGLGAVPDYDRGTAAGRPGVQPRRVPAVLLRGLTRREGEFCG